MNDLKGQTAVITGSGSGIGRGTALALAKRGVNIVVVDIDRDRIAMVTKELGEVGVEALGIAFDVATDSFDLLKTQVLDRFGRVDIVMNNAGAMIANGTPEQISLAEWHAVIDVNLLAVVKSNIAFIPLLTAQKRGHIVNTASFAGLFTYSFDRMPYAACKAAVVQISEGLAIYLRPQGVNVTVLCPGPVNTNIASSLQTSLGRSPIPLRIPGPQFLLKEPDEVGELVVDAILTNKFMVPTHAEVREQLIARATNWDDFIQNEIDHPNIFEPRTS